LEKLKWEIGFMPCSFFGIDVESAYQQEIELFSETILRWQALKVFLQLSVSAVTGMTKEKSPEVLPTLPGLW
jgi:hypothetical protein